MTLSLNFRGKTFNEEETHKYFLKFDDVSRILF